MSSISEYKIFLDQLTGLRTNEENELKKEENKLLKFKQDINESINIYSKDEVDKKINKYNILLNEYRSKVEQFNIYIDKNLNYNRSLALDKIASIVTSIARVQNIDLILESQNYFLTSDNIDLSNEVILKLSEKKFSFEIIE